MSKAIIIQASDPMRYEVRNLEEPLLDSLQNEVHGFIEFVRPTHLPRPYVMIIDEESALKEDRVVNLVPSILYGGLIFGDVVIMAEGFNEDYELDIVGLDCAMIDGLIDYFHTNGIMMKMEVER